MQILGILNVTRDSFSDGGQFLNADRAVAHARQLAADGATWIDVGAESTHPDAEDVPADIEIARLTPVIRALRTASVRVSIDTYKPAVMRAVLPLGVEIINDVTALRDPESVAAVRDNDARIILMHSTATSARAARDCVPPASDLVEHIRDWFRSRISALEAAGIRPNRLILDPGMGFFLGPGPAPSLAVLRHLNRLAELGLPICISTSRKSFIGATLGTPSAPRAVDQRGAGTLATELWAVQMGVQYVRTHAVRPLHDAVTLWQAIATAPQRC